MFSAPSTSSVRRWLAIVLAALLLGQRLHAAQLFGDALVIGAVLLVQFSLRAQVRAVDPRR